MPERSRGSAPLTGSAFKSKNRYVSPPAGLNLPVVLDFGKAETPSNQKRRRYAPIILLFSVLFALLVLRTMPVAPPSALDPVHDPQPAEAAPHIEASKQLGQEKGQQPAPSNSSAQLEAEPLARDASGQAATLTAAGQELQKPFVQTQVPPAAVLSAGQEASPTKTPPAALSPPVPLMSETAPELEARLAPALPLPPVPPPEPAAVKEGRLPGTETSPVAKVNLQSTQRPGKQLPTPPPLSRSGRHTGSLDLAAGQAHFAKGNLPGARAAFAKAFETGLAEAALALGNTFDPVSLAKAGVKDKGDPTLARRWYRRAFELNMRRPGRRRS